MSFLNIGQKLDKVMGKESELLDAARTGNLQTVDKLLTGKPRKSVGGGVLSHRLTSILHSTVNVNCTDKNGYTPLHHATVNGHREVVERLLKSDAEPGLTDHQGCTPCHLAAWHGDAEICLQLLNAGTENLAEVPSEITPVQVNHQNLSGDTALHSAAQYGHVAVVDVLLQKHANPSIRNLQEESPLDLAAQYGRKEVVQLLLIQFPDLVQRPLCNHSPLHLASRNGHKEVVQVLLDAGFFLHTLTDTGTALHEAALFGKLDVVKLLLERGINVYEKDQKGLTALDLVDAHKAKQKSYMEIKTAIIEHMEKLKLANLDDGDYDSLASTAKGPQEVSEKTPERTAPVPRPRTYIKESPTEDTHKDQYGYSHPQKDQIEDIDRVTSSTSSISEASSPPPLPPRASVFPTEDVIPVIVQPPKPPVTATSSTESKSPTLSGGKPTAMPRPKKPPRQKKTSPAPARRTSTEGSESSTSEPSIQTPETPPPNLPPKPTSPKVPPNPGSVRNSQKVIPSAMSNSTDENHVIGSSSVVTEQLHSSETETDQSKFLLEGSKTDQSGAITTDIDQPQPTYSEIDQSDKQSATDQSNRSSYGFQLSPTPELPLKPCAPNTIETIDPVFGTPVQQNVYMEMKPTETKQPEAQNTELKPGGVNVDNYDILFPKFKNTKGNSLQQSPSETKKPEFRRTNTAPDENIYVGPSSPESPLAKFKEKQGLLRRANTSPDENMYITVTEKILKRQEKVEIENEYSEISEQKSPQSPQSPSENVYEVIPEKRDSNVYAEVQDSHSGTKGRNSDVSDRDNSEAVSESSTMDNSKQKETDETDNIPAGSKPNYLDFVARKSLSHDPLTPTGYTQPPTPDFPPPSPATALQGIELKIQEMDDVIEV